MEKIKIKLSQSSIIELTEYELGEFLNEFCYYLKEKGIQGLGKENLGMEEFITSKKVDNAMSEFVKDKKKQEQYIK